MPIRYYSGVEGSGKTIMMTRDLVLHYAAGGSILSFPGYEVYGNTQEEILSQVILPEQLLLLVKDEEQGLHLKRQKIAVAMDEVTNFFNHHSWFMKICDILQAILAQRRKLGIAVLMSGQDFNVLPPDIRALIHEVIYCSDNHTMNHKFPRGEKCIYYKEDRRGLLSNPMHRFTAKKVFLMKPWRKHYDTYAAVDMMHQWTKVKILGREIAIDANGNIMEKPKDMTREEMDAAIATTNILTPPQLKRRENEDKIRRQLIYFKREKGLGQVPKQLMEQVMGTDNFNGQNGIGKILKEFGVTYRKDTKMYDLRGVI